MSMAQTNLGETFDSIRRRYSIRDIVGMGNKHKCVCPLPNHIHIHNTPSFSVFFSNGIEKFHCHGASCGASGDVLDLIGFMYIPGYERFNGKMYYQAASILTNGQYRISRVVAPPPIPLLNPYIWQDTLPPTQRVIDYAFTRGITMTEIIKFKIGALREWATKIPFEISDPEKWMTIPTFHMSDLIGIKLRNTDHWGLRYMALKGSRKGLFNYNAVYLTDQPVLLVKGEIAAIVADRFGFLACAPTGGEGSNVKETRTALALAKIIVVGDNDEVGITAANNRAMLFNGLIKFPPLLFKDIDQYLLEDPTSVAQVNQWIEEARNYE